MGGNQEIISNDYLSLYTGLQFPLYYGYMMVTDEKFSFVKKTHVSTPNLDNFLQKAKNMQLVIPFQYSNYKLPRVPVAVTYGGFEHALAEHLEGYMGVALIHFEGEPDQNYSPKFDETCIFDGKKQCRFNEKPEYTVIPTSNDYRIRYYYEDETKNREVIERTGSKGDVWKRKDLGEWEKVK